MTHSIRVGVRYGLGKTGEGGLARRYARKSKQKVEKRTSVARDVGIYGKVKCKHVQRALATFQNVEVALTIHIVPEINLENLFLKGILP